jgi:hypothetical protein
MTVEVVPGNETLDSVTCTEKLEMTMGKKAHNMHGALDANDIQSVIAMATLEDGLINSEIRSRVWPELIHIGPYLDEYLSQIYERQTAEDKEIQYRDAEQIQKDVERSFIYFNKNNDTQEAREIDGFKKRLYNLITNVLLAIPDLNYYQGYHDVASMVVIHFQDDFQAFQVLYVITLRFLRDHMMRDIQPTLSLLDLIPELIHHVDSELHDVVTMVKPIYALSSIITLFTHDITELHDISIIWDFILLRDDPRAPIYIYVALLVYYKDDISIDLNEMSDSTIGDSQQFDTDIVHAVLSNFIERHLHINSIDSRLELRNILQIADDIMKKTPLETLKHFKNISSYSFLRNKSTSLAIVSLQVEQYEKVRMKQERKRLMQEKLEKTSLIRRKAFHAPLLLKMTVGVGILSILLHTTLKHPNRIGLSGDISRNLVSFWDSLLDHFK